jgi:protein ImuB
LAIFAGNGNRATLVAATRRARQGGLQPGMTLPQARVLLPNLAVRPRDPECERAAQETLVETAAKFSPRIEDAGEGVIYLDITGLERHFPTSEPETDLARTLLIATEKAGLPAWAGIASSKLAAGIAAETPPSPRVVPPRQEARFLAPLPLNRLCPETRTYEMLHRWGIDTIGKFAALPRNQIAGRLGPLGHKLHEQARGLDTHPLVPRQTPLVFHEGMDLDWSLVSLEPFLFVGGTALERLCRRLETRGLACIQLSLSLRLEPNGSEERSILLPSPTCDARTLLTLTRLDLERQQPAAPVTGFTFAAYPDRPREAQLTIFGPTALSPDKLATTLARLFALLGPQRSGSPRAVDSHLPNRFQLVDFAPPAPPDTHSEATSGKGLLAVRVLRPAIALEVETTPGSDSGHPVTVRPATTIRGRDVAIQGRVHVASGPWRTEEDWWSETPADRDYWDVELNDGGVYRLYRDRHTGNWYADGIYD